jgi:hypothetical protein
MVRRPKCGAGRKIASIIELTGLDIAEGDWLFGYGWCALGADIRRH